MVEFKYILGKNEKRNSTEMCEEYMILGLK